MALELRRSTDKDRDVVIGIISECFGDRESYGAYTNIENGRYLLAIEDEKVIGVSGISATSEYGNNDPEFDFTAVLPGHRRAGVCRALFTELLKDFHGTVYYSAWYKHPLSTYPVFNILKEFGFVRVCEPRVGWAVPHNCEYEDTYQCVKYTGCNCKCFEDLWVLNKE
ncbi:MAG: GNAT family N-acetyltransferase [Lachnospiraceae bacterium]|nr:GNAT family N-acetyltransferase [Lachnospiraceae bacterium]